MANFFMFDKRLFKASCVVNKTTHARCYILHSDKFVYLYMRDRFIYHAAKGGEYFESLESIATQCCISKTTLKKSIDKWEIVGVVNKFLSKDSKGHTVVRYYVKDIKDFELR